MERTIVTSGKKYIDIDAYAGCIAYSKLLNSIGYKSFAVTSANYNESISMIIKNLGYNFDEYEPNSDDEFIILDVSNPDMFDEIVKIEKVFDIIDHHTGFENYWNEIGINNEIEFIGSVCTIVFEKYNYYNKLKLLDTNLCKLLTAGILDNTLNLKASITTERDINAYNKLLKIGNIADTWANEYFLSCQTAIEQDIKKALVNDMKLEHISECLPRVFGQLLIFDKTFVFEKLEMVKKIFSEYNEAWMLNIISLNDDKSYIFAEPIETRNKLGILLNKKFENGVLVLNKFMLRKEIIKLAREKDSRG